MKASRLFKISSLTFLGALSLLVLCLLTGLIWIYFNIQSPEKMRRHLPALQQWLKENAGVESQFGSVAIDLAKHFIIKNMSLKYDDTKLFASIQLKELSFQYNLEGIFDRIIVIENIFVDRLNLNINVKELPKTTKDQSEDENHSDPLISLFDILHHPPLHIVLNNLEWQQNSIQIEISDPSLNGAVHLSPISLKAKAKLGNEHSYLMGKVSIATVDKKNLTINQVSRSQNTSLNLDHVTFTSEFDFESNRTDKNLTIKTAPQFEIQFSKLQLKQKTKDHLLTMSWPQGQISQKTKSHFSSPNPTNDRSEPKNMPLPFHLNLDITSSAIDIILQDDQKSQTIVLTPHLSAKAKGQIDLTQQRSETINLELDTQGTIQNLRLLEQRPDHGTKDTTSEIEKLTFTQNLKLDGNFLNSKNTFQIGPIRTPFLNKAIKKAVIHLDGNGHRQFKDLEMSVQARVDKHSLLNLSASLKDENGILSLQHHSTLKLAQDLDQYIEGAKILKKIGDVSIHWNGQHSLTHNQTNWLERDKPVLEKEKFSTHHVITIQKDSAPIEKPLLRFNNPFEIKLAADSNEEKISSHFSVSAVGLHVKPLKQSVNLNLSGKQNISHSFKDPQWEYQLNLDNQHIGSFSGSAFDRGKSLAVDGKINLTIDHWIRRLLPNMTDLELIGPVDIAQSITAQVSHPQLPLLENFDNLDLNDTDIEIKARSKLTKRIDQNQKTEKNSEIKWLDPIVLNSEITVGKNRSSIINHISLPGLIANGIGSTNNTQIKAETSTHNTIFSAKKTLNIPKNLNFELNIQTDKLTIKHHQFNAQNLIDKLKVKMVGSLKNKKLSINNLTMSGGEKFFRVKTSLDYDITQKHIQSDGHIIFDLPDTLSDNPVIKTDGKLKFPWQLYLVKGKDIAIESHIIFNNIDIITDGFSFKSVDGLLHLDEKISIYNNNKFSFSSLVNQNPFNRVDYHSLRPYLSTQHRLSIAEIKLQNWMLGPFTANASIEQNMVSIPSFSLRLFGGDLEGRFYLDTYPKRLTFGLQARFTNINPAKISGKAKALLAPDRGNNDVISGNMSIIFDLRTRLVTGKINITQIGGPQLIHLINILDPENEDPELNTVRSLLGVGYPEQLSLEMKHGTMDMDVSIFVAGVSKSQQILGIPMTAMIETNIGPMIADFIRDYQNIYPVKTP